MEQKIEIPEKIEIEVKGRKIIVKGPKGTAEKDFDDPRFNKSIQMKKEDNSLVISSQSDNRKTKATIGTIKAHVRNMINGATTGYKYTMKITYSHFPISISVQGNQVQVKNFLGEKGSRFASVVGNTSVKVGKDEVVLTGINIEDVSQTAANIENICYISRKDRRIFQDGIFISSKTLEDGSKIK
jgi:large subunit ribosomal protein L6